MFFCVECGRLLEDDEYTHLIEPHGEESDVCPYCYGATERAYKCPICGEHFKEEDLTNGICDICAKKDFEYETALKYFIEYKLLRHFFLCWYWQVADSVSDDESEEFDKTLISIFNAKVQEDKETFRTAFYSQLKEYIFDDIYDWAEFLGKEVSENECKKK